METKFTKGEWKYRTNKDYDTTVFNSKNGLTVANVSKWSVKSKEELEANAKLIAAAPEMFESLKIAQAALELCRQHMRDNSNLNLWHGLSAPDRIKDVIKKATE
jgi:hypothetical protein